MLRWLKLAAAAFLAFWLVAAAAFAFDTAIVGQSERLVDSLKTDVEQISNDLQRPVINDAKLSAYRATLDDIRTKALTQSEKLTAAIAELNQQITQLGPAPADGQQEPEDVAKQRAALQSSLDQVKSAKSQLDVLAVEAEQLTGRISVIQRDQFFQRVFSTGPSIFNPGLWLDTATGVSTLATRLGGLFNVWWRDVSKTANPIGLALIPICVFIALLFFRWLSRQITRWTDARSNGDRPLDDLTRLWRIARGQISTAVALFILFFPILVALDVSGYLTRRFGLVLDLVFNLVSTTLIFYMLARRVAAPALRQWRVVDLDDKAASRLPFLVGLIAFLSVAQEEMVRMADALFVQLKDTIGLSSIGALLMLVLLALTVLTLRRQAGLGEAAAGRRVYLSWTGTFTPVIWVLISIGFIALALGYLALATFIAQQIFQTCALLIALFLLHNLADATVSASFEPQSGFGRLLRNTTGMSERAIERLGLVFRTAVDVILVLAGLPLLLLLWTVTWVDFRSIINSAMLGVRIGAITVSPWTVLLVIAVVAGGITLTKLVIRWLDRRILSETRLDKGVQDSIRKGASYTGYILAGGFALTAAGLDFSNLAIIAGALGVGIGFGLQSIVNNFVSGLILLAERPIRVGDWVVMPSGEGIVKQINVRSTEVETFDACTIIVPNSNLISEPVKNWTHGSPLGRLSVAITVSYDSDPEEVRTLLLDIAREHPKVLTGPPPFAVLMRFSPIGLDFEVRAYVADALDAFTTASDIRFTLLRKLREKGITIPVSSAVLQNPNG